MRRLSDLGCRFALDDFGIGFSTFSYLQSLPADLVKIDGSFIRGLDASAANRALVRAIDTVAHTLGKETIAESVESLDSVKTLVELGVRFGRATRSDAGPGAFAERWSSLPLPMVNGRRKAAE